MLCSENCSSLLTSSCANCCSTLVTWIQQKERTKRHCKKARLLSRNGPILHYLAIARRPKTPQLGPRTYQTTRDYNQVLWRPERRPRVWLALALARDKTT